MDGVATSRHTSYNRRGTTLAIAKGKQISKTHIQRYMFSEIKLTGTFCIIFTSNFYSNLVQMTITLVSMHKNSQIWVRSSLKFGKQLSKVNVPVNHPKGAPKGHERPYWEKGLFMRSRRKQFHIESGISFLDCVQWSLRIVLNPIRLQAPSGSERKTNRVHSKTVGKSPIAVFRFKYRSKGDNKSCS